MMPFQLDGLSATRLTHEPEGVMDATMEGRKNVSLSDLPQDPQKVRSLPQSQSPSSSGSAPRCFLVSRVGRILIKKEAIRMMEGGIRDIPPLMRVRERE